jgi:DNA sulfur modification protein DndD
MIIRKITIKNFRSYYGENEFDLKDGLTLIIGDNGDGKTTFFEALEWLFNTSTQDVKKSNISAKRRKELVDGESDEVKVSIAFQHEDGDKIVEKSFQFANEEGNIVTRDFVFKGYECYGAERSLTDGKALLDRCFDYDMRRYCLFKGENELNVFENDTALKALVAKFSDVRQFDKYVELSTVLEEKSDRNYKRELKSDSKTEKEAKRLDKIIEDLKGKISDAEKDLKKQQQVSDDFNVRIDDLANSDEVRTKYKEIQNRLATLQEKRSKVAEFCKINYNHKLLDDLWILCAFPDILKSYQIRVSGANRQRRRMNEKYIENRGRLKGQKDALTEITHNQEVGPELDWDIPGPQVLEEMIQDHRCKICGHPAPEGSPELEFMKQRLANYYKHLEDKNKEIDEQVKEAEKPLFQFNYLSELRTLSTTLSGENQRELSQLKNIIHDKIQFVAARKEELIKLDKQIEEMEDDKKNLLIQANLSESIIDKDIKDLRGYFHQKQIADDSIYRLKSEIKDYKKKKEELELEYSNLKPNSGMGKVYEKVHRVFQAIMKAFLQARKENLRHFINELTEHANKYLSKLNAGDFHGEVQIDVREDDKARIYLISNGERIMDPNGALKTTMYMSILFAISDITTQKREDDYPLIFDAPTSSFGEVKEDLFYNIIDSINKQCIIVTKDLLVKDEETGSSRIDERKLSNLKCSVYRIEKEAGFNSNDITTISTKVERIK